MKLVSCPVCGNEISDQVDPVVIKHSCPKCYHPFNLVTWRQAEEQANHARLLAEKQANHARLLVEERRKYERQQDEQREREWEEIFRKARIEDEAAAERARAKAQAEAELEWYLHNHSGASD